MKRVRFTGSRRKGTLNPRRVWSPDETLMVDEAVAIELASAPDFTIVEVKTRRKLEE